MDCGFPLASKTGKALGRDFTLADLRSGHDAVFLGIGLAGNNTLGMAGENSRGIDAATNFIADLRQVDNLGKMPVGRDVVVIGGGMTAIDAAVQAKLLGALNVSIVYRRGRERMNASVYEQELAASRGVVIHTNAVCIGVTANGAVKSAEFEYVDDAMKPTGTRFTLAADQLLTAIGQSLFLTGAGSEKLELEGNKIKTDAAGRTSIKGVWAGGDCASDGDDLTVTAVAQGRDAAEDINRQI